MDTKGLTWSVLLSSIGLSKIRHNICHCWTFQARRL